MKKRSIAANLLVLASAAVSFSAQAASVASSSASISNFSYQLIDLDLADGIASSIVFTSYSSAADSTGFSNFAGISDSRTTLGATSVVDRIGRASTLVTPTSVSSTATGLLPIDREQKFSATALYTQQFTLSANTMVIFSADASLRQDNPGSSWLRQDTRATMWGQLDIGGGAGQPNYESRFADEAYPYIVSGSVARDTTLIGALGSLSSTAHGSINLRTISISGWQVEPVPEPGTYAMLLAGLGLVGFVSRRKRASAR